MNSRQVQQSLFFGQISFENLAKMLPIPILLKFGDFWVTKLKNRQNLLTGKLFKKA